MQTFLDDVRRFVGLDAEDTARLRDLGAVLEPRFATITAHFYASIFAHPNASATITGGAAQAHALEDTLIAWMASGLRGPYDDEFYDTRTRIGRRHVELGLPQHYMIAAMGVLRQDYHTALEGALANDPARLRASLRAVDRLLDVELAILLQTYRVDAEDQLRRSERLATIGIVAATIGHDLRNPLGVIESSAFLLRRTVLDEHGLRHLHKIDSHVRACNRIVTALLELARASVPRYGVIDPRVMFDGSLALIAIPDGVRVRIEVDERLELEADIGLLEQVVVNLVLNSIAAMGTRPGEIVLRASRHDDRFDALTVVDDGPGFDPAMLPRAFEPLVTSRATGVGLGLALVKSVAERHKGIAIAENAARGGAIVRLLLPIRKPVDGGDA